MKVLFAPETFEKLRPVIESLLAGNDIHIAGRDEVPDLISQADVLVTGPLDVDEKLLEKGPSLRLIQQWGAGVERIDIEACSKKSVAVCNVPSGGTGNAEGVAEIVLMHMLLLARRFGRSQDSIRRRRLYSPQGVSLWKKRVCVIGLGDVGQSIAERLKGMGMYITAVNRTRKENLKELGIDRFFSLDHVRHALSGCRFVVLALALNERTKGIADKKFFRAMDPGSYLVNVGRAELVCRKDLELALENGKLSGAGFDVFWDEPADPSDSILKNPLVTVTPHIGGLTDESLLGVAASVAENISRLEKGMDLLNCLNKPASGRNPL